MARRVSKDRKIALDKLIEDMFLSNQQQHPTWSFDRLCVETSEKFGYAPGYVAKIMHEHVDRATEITLRAHLKQEAVKEYFNEISSSSPGMSYDRVLLEVSEKFFLSMRTTNDIVNSIGPYYDGLIVN